VVKDMDIYEQLPVLLSIEIKNDSLELRLDKNGFGCFSPDEKSIQEIILSNFHADKKLVNRMQELITEVFEYEVFEENGQTIFQFWGDYGRIEGEIECENFTEEFFEYSKIDLVQKGTALYNLYVDLYERFTKISGVNFQLKNKLKFEIDNQIERTQRKVDFFAEKDRGKSEAFNSEIKFLKKLQKILN
jgi:hypothetical protein